MKISLKQHWNEKYASSPVNQLGWYESRSEPSLRLIENCATPKEAGLIDIGSGATTLIPNLLELVYEAQE
jgi:hypothetical protein